MVKKFLCLFCIVFIAKTLNAQVYRNDWIDYSKTYYKFKLGPFGSDASGPIKKGVVRIPQSTLLSAGLANVPAENFQLWNNGVQIPIYITKPSGILGSSDFIEFWGEMANGKIDNDLFKDPNSQLSDYWNIETDSSSYFLTSNSSTGNNLRLTNTINDAKNSTLTAEKNFTYTTGSYFRDIPYPGFGIGYSGLPLFLSSYEPGEGYVGRAILPNSCGCYYRQLEIYFTNLKADTTATTCTVKVNMVGNGSNNRNVRIWLNKDAIATVPMGYFNYSKTVVPNLAASRLKNDSATIAIENTCAVSSDEIRVATVELVYNRKFDFGGASVYEFNINASSQGRLLKIVNFNKGAATPVLYDITNGKRYTAYIASGTDTLQFLLQPSSQNYNLVLLRNDGSTAKTISSLETRNFTDYSKVSNQGNYIIISNPSIYGNDTSNYVEQYRAYRSSAAGGSYNAKLVSITDLEDQFAYGSKMHPQAIRAFMQYARSNFNVPPAYLFIIGKGISYYSYRRQGESALTDQLNLVPTFGYPGSDNLLTSDNTTDYPLTPVGRLSAVTPQEVGVYLNKVKEYDLAQKNTSDSIETKSWMKQVLHLTGADDALLGNVLDTSMASYTKIIQDTAYGGNVISFSKSADPQGYANAVINFKDIFNSGSSLITYFGHSSSSILDFSLDDPGNYSNSGKYPFFIANGCLAGNIFDYDAQRQSIVSTIAEKYILAPHSGSIAYLATSSYGIVNYLDIFTKEYYTNMASESYGKGLGDIIKNGINESLVTTGFTDFFGRMHAHQYTFNGDPALRMNTFAKPDYAIETSTTQVPSFISAADDSFPVRIKIYNLGKATNDSIQFSMYRLCKTGDSCIVFSKKLSAIKSFDTLLVKLPITPNRDTGYVTYSAIIDSKNKVKEISENNNRVVFTTNIDTKELRPVYPYNYSIINNNRINLIASTAYALEPSARYWFEIDTSALFNSPGKVRIGRAAVKGGIVESPVIKLPLNNTTYYWRAARAGENPIWHSFSFTYQQDSSFGYQQSHFYQHTQSNTVSMYDDSASRQWTYGGSQANLFLKQSVYPTSGSEDFDFQVAVNGTALGVSACVGSSIIFHVFDPKTMQIITNTTNPYGAAPPCGNLRANNFEFATDNPTARKNAMNFLDYFVQNGYYVAIRKIYDLGGTDWAPTVWAADTALYGHNNSLYHRLKDQGLMIDSFIYPRTFIMVYKKNDSAHFKPVSVFSKGIYDQIVYSGNIATVSPVGMVQSPSFGPVNQWQKVSWNGTDLDGNNKASMQVVAYDKYGKDSVFYTLQKNQTQDISNIDAKKYPYIQLHMSTVDSTTVIPYQLNLWKLNGKAAPEGAIAPNLGIRIPANLAFTHDVNMQFDTLKGFVAFKNISREAFNPLTVKITMQDSAGKVYSFPGQPLTRALPAGDTLQIGFLINVKKLPSGKYNFILEVNPDYAQPEQYHFNNTLYKDVTITRNIAVQNTAIANNSKQDIKNTITVSPNPFTDKLQIKTNYNGNAVVRLMDVKGVAILSKNFYGTTQLNTSSLSSGIYIAEIICGVKKEIFKVEK